MNAPRLFALLVLCAGSSALSASGMPAEKFTGLGATLGYEYGSHGNITPAVALTQGAEGLFSAFGTIEAGYRVKDEGFMARAKVELYLLNFGVYAGVQSNTGKERASVYGFPLGFALLIPVGDPWLMKLHVGAALYTQEQANEFQAALSVFYRIW